MLTLKELKRILFNKKCLYIIFAIVVLYFVMFIMMKDKYYFELINYIPEYIQYYSNKYLDGDVSSLVYNNSLWFFVENEVVGIFSSIYIFFMTQQSLIFSLLLFLLPIMLFYLIFDYFYYEIHCGFYKNILIKLGKKKYMRSKLYSIILFGGIFMVIPKCIYYIFLHIFFSPQTTTHYINNANFISEKFFFIQEHFSPQLLLAFDFGITFLYGVIISMIVILIILLNNKRSQAYITFIFVIAIQAILSVVFKNISIPIIFLYSICETIDFSIMLSHPITITIYVLVTVILLFISARIIFKKKICE